MTIKLLTEWQQLETHFQNELKQKKIVDLFEQKETMPTRRFEQLSFQFDQLFIDFSKQKLTPKTINLLLKLAESRNLKNAIDSLMNGQKVNSTENKAALHCALRFKPEESLWVDGDNINNTVQSELGKMAQIVGSVHQGHWRGYSGKPITDVVNLGVGGSDLGPLLVSHALTEFQTERSKQINFHFVSTMDGVQVSSIFETLNPETTLFIIVSKSFSTIDTLANASSAKAWLLNYCENEKIVCKQHFIGISANQQKMSDWGIANQHQLQLWEWVGGRFSLWSSVGLSIALSIGMDNFRQLLNGANAMDKHFSSAEFDKNIPVLMGLIGIWNTNFLKINAHAILPYDGRLSFFPDYLTQLEMESNGKSVTHGGIKIDYHSCPILWGEVGSNAQHAFYQLLHQGTRRVTCDFIAPINHQSQAKKQNGSILPNENIQQQSLLALANCFAQSRAFMLGDHPELKSSKVIESTAELNSHKTYPGNQSSTTILLTELTPYSLGQLIALYEHKVFVMASIWDINPFDQWGVELGKTMAKQTLSALNSEEVIGDFDPSTNGLLNFVKSSFQAKSEKKSESMSETKSEAKPKRS